MLHRAARTTAAGSRRPGRPRRARRPRAVAAAAVLVAGVSLAAPSAAAADERGTEEVTGTLVRAYDMDGRFDLDSGPLDAPAEHGDHADPGGHSDHSDQSGPAGRTAQDDDPDAGLLAWVEDGADTVRVPVDDVAHVPTGAEVEVVVGEEVPDRAAEGGLEPAREVLDATVLAAGSEQPPEGVVDAGDPTAATTPAVHQVTLVMAVPAGGSRDSATLTSVADALDGPVSSFWSGQTGGAVSFTVTSRVDWTSLSAGCDDPTALWNEAARRARFTPGPNQHLVVYLGDRGGSTTCSAGLATVGDSPSDGGVAYVTSASTSLMAHELGHNLGLYHSAKLRCAGVVEAGPADSGCSVSEYLDLYDVMGGAWSQVGSLSAHQAHRLGVLAAAEGADVAAQGGTYTLAPISSRGGVRALRLRDGAQTYWLEHRAPTGQDSWLGTGANSLGLQAGVLLRREVADPTNYSSLLLDPTPSGSAEWARDFKAALPPGSTTTVSDGRWRVGVGAVTSSGATVTVAPTGAGVTATPDGTFTGTPTSGPTPAPAPTARVTRREGATRYETAVAISAASHPGGARSAVVASGEQFPDALAAGPVAARGGGPLLLVPRSGPVPEAVLAELRRLQPASITLAGGPSAVDEGVAAQLAAVAPVTRRAGGDRYETAAQRSVGAGARGGTVFLASGATHADAVAGAALAAKVGGTVLLTGRDALPAATSQALTALAPSTVVVLGGYASLGAEVDAGVRAAVPGAALARRAGEDRYETAAQVAEAGYPDGAGTVYLARGDAFPDALAGGPAAGAASAPLMLTRGTCVPAVTLSRIAALGAQEVVLLGGPAVVSAEVAALRSC